jgi:hypothetical protein
MLLASAEAVDVVSLVKSCHAWRASLNSAMK